MAAPAPRLKAFTMCPGLLMPPSAKIGTPYKLLIQRARVRCVRERERANHYVLSTPLIGVFKVLNIFRCTKCKANHPETVRNRWVEGDVVDQLLILSKLGKISHQGSPAWQHCIQLMLVRGHKHKPPACVGKRPEKELLQLKVKNGGVGSLFDGFSDFTIDLKYHISSTHDPIHLSAPEWCK